MQDLKFPDQESNPHPLQQKHRVLNTGSPGKTQVNRILKFTKPNSVVMNYWQENTKKESKFLPEFDFSAHKYFSVVKLV